MSILESFKLTCDVASVFALLFTPSDGHDKPFCAKALTIIDNFKNALSDTDKR